MRRERVINKLRELKYKFRRDAWRVSIWKKGTHEVHVPKRDILSEDWVRSTLTQAGCAKDEIDRFIQACNN